MTLRLTLLLIFFFPLTQVAQAQHPLDSLKQVWSNPNEADSERYKAINRYYISQTFAQPDTVIILTDFHYNLALANDSKSQMAKALNEKSYAYYLKGDTRKSMAILDETIEIYKELDDKAGLALIYGNMGNIYGQNREYQKAVSYFDESMKVSQEMGKEKEVARMLSNLGIIYASLDNNELALTNYQKAIAIYERLGLTNKTGTVIKEIGAIYYKQGNYKEAIVETEKALTILLEDNNQVNVSNCYFQLAQCYKKLNQNDKAFVYVNKSIEIDAEIKNNSKKIERLTFKADLAFDTDVNLATKKANAVRSLLKDDTEHILKANLYQLLYKCYKAKGEYNTSLLMHEQYAIYNDSLQIEKNEMSIIEDAIQRDFDEKLYENNLENEKIQTELKLTQLKKTFGIIGFSVLLILGIITYYRNHIKKNRKKREQLLAQLEALKKEANSNLLVDATKFELSREKLERSIARKLNDTDWNILNIIFDDPVIPNKDIAEKAFKSVEGVSSSLRRMYEYFDIEGSKYKKIALLMDAIKRSNTVV